MVFRLFGLSLKERLLAAFLAVAVVTLLVAGIGYYALEHARRAIREADYVRLSSARSMLVISEAQTTIKLAQRLLANDRLTAENRQELYDVIAQCWKRAAEAWATYQRLPKTKRETQLANQFLVVWSESRSKTPKSSL